MGKASRVKPRKLVSRVKPEAFLRLNKVLVLHKGNKGLYIFLGRDISYVYHILGYSNLRFCRAGFFDLFSHK